MISKEEARIIAENKVGEKAKFVCDHTDGRSYMVVFGGGCGSSFWLVDKDTGEVQSIRIIDLLI